MLDLRKQRNSEGRAEDAFAALLEGLTGGTPPDYNDPFVAVSYLIQYQLSHCAMAFAVWWNFSTSTEYRPVCQFSTLQRGAVPVLSDCNWH